MSLEHAYNEGILGGVAILSGSAVRTVDPDCRERFNNSLSHIGNLRAHQCVLDALVRVSKHKGLPLCAPHLPSVYTRAVPDMAHTTRSLSRKWNVLAKSNVSLGEALAYAVRRCDPTRFRGVLLPLTVSTANGTNDHANMVLVDYVSASLVRCYLFEPNGRAFVKRHPKGWTMLTRAWAYASRVVRTLANGKALESTVRLVGAHVSNPKLGLQTLLGTTRTKRVGNTIITQRRGYGICGAVTYWLLVLWLWRSKPHETLEQYHRRLYHDVQQDPAASKACLLSFIRKVNAYVSKRYATYTRPYVVRDVQEVVEALTNGKPARIRGTTWTMIFYNAKRGTKQQLLHVNGRV